MTRSNLTGRALAAVAGVAMLVATATSASAFTLSSPSLEPTVAGANIEHVWWRGGWHGGWHRGWGYGGWHGGWHRGWGPGWGWGWGWRRHCWRCW